MMKRIFLIITTFFSVLILSGLSSLKAQALIDLESGVVFSGYNDVRIPGDQGTLFSLSKELDSLAKSVLPFKSRLYLWHPTQFVSALCTTYREI